jgi:hypothetical protein
MKRVVAAQSTLGLMRSIEWFLFVVLCISASAQNPKTGTARIQTHPKAVTTGGFKVEVAIDFDPSLH